MTFLYLLTMTSTSDFQSEKILTNLRKSINFQVTLFMEN